MARLGAEGIVCELRGATTGPYPLPGPVDVYVPAVDAEDARHVLIGDAVDAAFLEPRCDGPAGPGSRRLRGAAPGVRHASRLWAIAAVVAIAAFAIARILGGA